MLSAPLPEPQPEQRRPKNLQMSLADIAEKYPQLADWDTIQPNTPNGDFILGGYHAIAAVEYVLQIRYAHYSNELPMVPGGRTTIPINPKAEFDPAFVEIAMDGALMHFARAQSFIEKAIGEEIDVTLNLNTLWFDIDGDGDRSVAEQITGVLDELPQFDSNASTDVGVDFDKADADWLAAYIHVLSGMAEMVNAMDPTSAIKEIYDARAVLERFGDMSPTPVLGDSGFVDTAAAFLLTFRGQPEKKRTRKALAHFKSMIVHNQRFWTLLMEETDDGAEWLPNPRQTSAFGMTVNQETAQAWQGVLAEISDILEGNTLLPYWRLSSRDQSRPDTGDPEIGVGINFEKLMNDPKDFDIILILQGAAVAPFLEEGEIADMRAAREFAEMTNGQTGLLTMWFN